MQLVSCQKCGAGLPTADEYGRAWCGFCCTMNEPSAERLAEAAARIAMNDTEVLALLRRHFALAESVSMYLAPTLPQKNIESARRTHAAHLPLREPILAIYDDTLFESGEDGFVVTSRRLCWKNEGDIPCSIEWKDLDPDKIFADGRRLTLGRGMLVLYEESVIDAAADAFHILAISARLPSEPAQRGPSGTQLMPSAPPRPSARPTFRPPHAPTLESAIAPAPIAKASSAPPAQETPPPPNASNRPAYSYVQYAVHASSQPAPGFECWNCRTPLYGTTPRCARCGAFPAPYGWRRTA